MKRAALASALTSQLTSGNVIVVDGMSNLPAKTKEMAKALNNVGAIGKILLATGGEVAVTRAARNIVGVDVILANNLYAYAVLSHQKVILTKDAISTLKKS